MQTNKLAPCFPLSYGTFVCNYIGDEGGGLAEISHGNIIYRTLSDLSIRACFLALKEVENEFNLSCCSIGKRLGWTPQEEKEEIGVPFTNWIQMNPIRHLTVLDLSNLNIKLLPPQIAPELFPSVENLNLKNNQLRVLPNALQFFPLKELNISGNAALQTRLPTWLSKINGLRLIANEINLFTSTTLPSM